MTASPAATNPPVPSRSDPPPRQPDPTRVGARPLRAAGATTQAPPTSPLGPMPRTSPRHPWDRARGPVPAPGTGGPVGPDTSVHLLPTAVPTEDPAAWCGSLVRAAVEALAGSRPATQLARWLTADLYESLARRSGLALRIHGRPRLVRHTVVRRVHLCRIDARTAEASVVVHDGERVRAAAVRVEAHRGRWRATALEIG